ncbi:MAG: triose-phosphate isomerase [Anaerolinea sp.]|nr:triose-phosphate isomerase [Anaerolinea sp.]MCC6976332.1 triose-phosphate isomerase [Anaerolineae bacterium]CAG1008132.1 triosephosphate isomerase (TIM) [Anaerolineae bacterium]
MRTPIIAGNWKMNKTPSEAVEYVKALLPRLQGLSQAERVVCPPFVALPGVAAALTGTALKVGAQNVHEKDSGAFTGNISAPMLKGLAEYVIIGHSEVRQYLGDTDAMINAKAKALLHHGFKPIIAVGESDELNRKGETVPFVGAQVRAAFAGIPAEQVPLIVVAYEPIWAIGTGRAPNPEEANAIIKSAVRDILAELYGAGIAAQVRIQYGGSVTPANMEGFMSQPDIDGGLVGGASLKADDFVALIELAIKAKAR